MAKPSILILENDSAAKRQLQDVLSRGGFKIEEAASPEEVVNLLRMTPYPLVFIDAEQGTLDLGAYTATLKRLRPESYIIYCGSSPSADVVLSVVRSGASDYLTKPFDPSDLVKRVKDNLSRRQKDREEVRKWKQRARKAEEKAPAAPPPVPSGKGVTKDQAITALLEFADNALQTFTALERANQDLEKENRELRDPGGSAASRPVVGYIAHHDPNFVKGMTGQGKKLSLQFRSPLATGGEILDKVGGTGPQVVLLGDMLPDIPTPMVIETLKSQHPDVSIVLIEGWGSAQQSARLESGSNEETVNRLIRNVGDLNALVMQARERAADAAFGREFAEKFRSRHGEFLKRYADIKRRFSSR